MAAWIKAKYVEQRFRHHPDPASLEEFAQFEADSALLAAEASPEVIAEEEGEPSVWGTETNGLNTWSNRGRVQSCNIAAFCWSNQAEGTTSSQPSLSSSSSTSPYSRRRLSFSTKRNELSNSVIRAPSPSSDVEGANLRGSTRLTKKEVEKGWASIQSEWQVSETDREQMMKQQKQERKRMIGEAKQRKKERNLLRRSGNLSEHPLPTLSLPTRCMSLDSMSELGGTALPARRKSGGGQIRRLSQNLTALLTSTRGRSASVVCPPPDENLSSSFKEEENSDDDITPDDARLDVMKEKETKPKEKAKKKGPREEKGNGRQHPGSPLT